jgi:prephenate dehydrogenase
MTKENLRISIIGFGNFGKFTAKHLIQKGISIRVTDIYDKTKEAEEIGAEFVSLNEACKNKIIILAMPMENLKETLLKIKDKLQAGTLVLDVCSLKMFSCEAMNLILPKNIEIIGTHPLFGPQSAKNSIEGMKIALINVRARAEIFKKIRRFIERLGLKIIETTSEEHDKQMAISQALTHFIGMICKNMDIQKVELSTKTFDDLMKIVEIIKNDSPELFNNMQQMNPFAKQMRERFVDAARELEIKLNSGYR